MSKGYSECFSAYSKSSAYPTKRSFSYIVPDSVESGLSLSGKSHTELLQIFHEILENKIHGISFSPYAAGQSPKNTITEQQILQRLSVLAPCADWVRSFSCIDGNQETPRIAHGMGLQNMVGIGLGEDRKRNELEFNNGIAVAKAGYADILAVGNEVLLRGDLAEDQLIDYILRAKEAVPDVTIGYVDAYFLFETHPRLLEVCDVLLINCYPFWEYTPAEYASLHVQSMYQDTVSIAKGKKVIIAETGWPSAGTPYGDSVPSLEHALKYFVQIYQWANRDGVQVFYFSSFDEAWKASDEGDVGAFWGLWDENCNLKYGLDSGGNA